MDKRKTEEGIVYKVMDKGYWLGCVVSESRKNVWSRNTFLAGFILTPTILKEPFDGYDFMAGTTRECRTCSDVSKLNLSNLFFKHLNGDLDMDWSPVWKFILSGELANDWDELVNCNNLRLAKVQFAITDEEKRYAEILAIWSLPSQIMKKFAKLHDKALDMLDRLADLDWCDQNMNTLENN